MSLLRRQGKPAANAQQIAIPAGPSVIFDETQGPVPGATQQQQQHRRNKQFVTPDAIEEAVKLTVENKVNAKNAWSVPLIEGMEDSVQLCLAANDGDQHTQFSKVALLVEGGAKVWSHRAESTFKLSEQIVRRLLRNNGGDNSGDEKENEDGDENKQQRKERRRKKVLERTIALSVDEINADLRTRSDKGAQATISPLFRAMSEKFDQSSAVGLLLNNAPFGRFGNVILDIDYAQCAYDQRHPRTSQGTTVSKSSLDAATLFTNETAADVNAENVVIAFDPQDSTRLSGALQRLSGGSASTVGGGAPSVNGSGLLFVPNHPEVQRALLMKEEQASINQTRAASVASRAADMESNGDWGDDNGGGDDFDDEDDRPVSVDVFSRSRMASEARDFASGALSLHQQDYIQGSALVADNPDWVALSQQAATSAGRAGFRNTGLLSTLRSQFSIRKSLAVSTEDAPKRRRLERVISFQEATTNEADQLKAFKKLRDITTGLTKLGAEFAKQDSPFDAQQYKLPDVTLKRSLDNKLLLAPSFADQASSSWLPTDYENVSTFFQPFATTVNSWNLLCKTQGSTALQRHAEYDRDGNSPATDALQDMPPDVFADGYDDYDDGDHDPEPPVNQSARNSGFLFNPEHSVLARLSGSGPLPSATNFSTFGSQLPQGDSEELLKVLRGPKQTAPSQVNVVELRRVMWEQTKLRVHTTADPHDHIAPAKTRKLQQQQQQLHRDDYAEDDGTSVKFSDIVEGVIPAVQTFSSSGTLSPAFFFFSILFLANEHGIVLENISDGNLSDLVVKGLSLA